jgi:hypothetical protein
VSESTEELVETLYRLNKSHEHNRTLAARIVALQLKLDEAPTVLEILNNLLDHRDSQIAALVGELQGLKALLSEISALCHTS